MRDMVDNMAQKLSEIELQKACGDWPNWHLAEDGSAFSREFVFSGFNAAFGFMTSVALAAERANHHPEWSNIYNRVTVRWTTHSVDGVSDLDLKLMKRCEELAGV